MSNVTTKRTGAPQTESSYLTPEDIQSELKLSRSTIYRILRSGELPYVRFKRKIRVRREVFEDWCRTAEESSVKESPTAGQSRWGKSGGTKSKEDSADVADARDSRSKVAGLFR